MRKAVKYPILLALTAVLGYNSVFFKKLDEVKAAGGPNAAHHFDAAAYAKEFWAKKLLPIATQPSGPTMELPVLLTALKADPKQAFAAHSHALGIGNIRYFLVRGAGTIKAVNPTDVTVQLSTGEEVQLATEYVFGNAARDASGLIRNQDFDNTADLNQIAEQLNAIIRQEVVAPLKAQAKLSQAVQFAGAMELNQAHLHLDELELIPLAVTLNAQP